MSQIEDLPDLPPNLMQSEKDLWLEAYLVCDQVLCSEARAYKAFQETVKREPNGRPNRHVNRDMFRRFESLVTEALRAQATPMLSKYALQTLTSKICSDWLKAALDEWELTARKPYEYGEWS